MWHPAAVHKLGKLLSVVLVNRGIFGRAACGFIPVAFGKGRIKSEITSHSHPADNGIVMVRKAAYFSI